MEISKTLSSQRNSEEDDLLERSQKKLKHTVGNPGSSAMEIVDESQAAADTENQAMGSGIMLTDPPPATQNPLDRAVPEPVTMDVVPETPSAMAGVDMPEMRSTPSLVAQGNPAPRSYLATVVGNGAGTAPFMIASTEDVAIDGETSGQNSTPGPLIAPGIDRPTNGGGLMGGRPYGSWMIATRRERRQQGRPTTVAPVTTQNLAKPATRGTGSRFSLLESEAQSGDGDAVVEGMDSGAVNCAAATVNERPHSETRGSGSGGRSRRANVIVSEKQIANEPPRSSSGPTREVEPTQGRRVIGSVSRRAAEEDEHVVNRGAQGGRVINTMTVHNEDTASGEAAAVALPTTEHSGDPPDGRDEEGDVIMELGSQQEISLGHRGAAAASVYAEFVDWIQTEGLIDMGFSGPRYTWTKGLPTGQAKAARLDRVLCNLSWRNLFPASTVTHLPRVSSDHTPLLIRMFDEATNRVKPTFKFQRLG
nr:uncharacterized protein LOC109175135 [Ipomoea batatas]